MRRGDEKELDEGLESERMTREWKRKNEMREWK